MPRRKGLALERAKDGDVEGVIHRLLALPEVVCVHVRNTEAGCFVARIVANEA